MSEEVFSMNMPDLDGLIKQLDMFNDEQNEVIRETLHDIGNDIQQNQRRLISESEVADLLVESITCSSIYTTKKVP